MEIEDRSWQLVTAQDEKRIEKFEDLLAWQEARALTQAIYTGTRTGQLSKDYGLRDQLQWAAVSVMSNVAEGFERINKQEKLHFLNIARASCGEVRSLLYVCSDAGLLDHSTISQLQSSCTTTGRLITGFMRSLRNGSSKIEDSR
jgi:four helix bundle protein